jgi:hypothetical protein
VGQSEYRKHRAIVERVGFQWTLGLLSLVVGLLVFVPSAAADFEVDNPGEDTATPVLESFERQGGPVFTPGEEVRVDYDAHDVGGGELQTVVFTLMVLVVINTLTTTVYIQLGGGA